MSPDRSPDDGYTLVEAMVGLMIVGLLMAGIVGGVRAAARLQQQATAQQRTLASDVTVAATLQRLLDDQGPFPSSGGQPFSGAAKAFSFASRTGAATAQIVKGGIAIRQGGEGRLIPLVHTDKAHFLYTGDKTSGDRWPPDNPTDWQRLRAVALIEDRANAKRSVIADVRLWIESETAPVAPASPS